MILPAEKLTLTGKYWARVPGLTDWFLLDLKRVDPDQMVGLEFKPILPPQ